MNTVKSLAAALEVRPGDVLPRPLSAWTEKRRSGRP